MTRPRIAVPVGDPAGIGPEIALKATADDRVRQICEPLLIGDAAILSMYAYRLGLPLPENPVDVGCLDTVEPGKSTAACGRAALAYAARAIRIAEAGEAAATVACPHTQSSIAAAGISFDGYPSFLARETGADPDDIFLMLVSDRLRIAHVTLHVDVRTALELIDGPRILRALRATAAALGRIGVASPRIAVSGVNPHAGEGGLFGKEEIETVSPAVEEARRGGIDVRGPFGADAMYLDDSYDAYLVMFHDQGHIPAKLAGGAAAFAIGAPVLFSSVAHGSALGIAGKGTADPEMLIRAILQIAGAR